jgi:hypothetical protein
MTKIDEEKKKIWNLAKRLGEERGVPAVYNQQVKEMELATKPKIDNLQNSGIFIENRK